MISTLEQRIIDVRDQVSQAARNVSRDPGEITIVAVSKTFPRGDVDVAYAAGLRVFGENRVQEAAAKFETPLPHDATVHLIGQLQTNKVKHALSVFGCIESVDRPSLVEALEREAAKLDRTVSVLVQVNITREPQKSGCAPEEAAGMVELIDRASHLTCGGFMTIAQLVSDPEKARPSFAGLRVLRDELGGANRFPILSMGMSNDFEVAISEGATHIRVGRAIFGTRT